MSTKLKKEIKKMIRREIRLFMNTERKMRQPLDKSITAVLLRSIEDSSIIHSYDED